jgi:hypothetical protein
MKTLHLRWFLWNIGTFVFFIHLFFNKKKREGCYWDPEKNPLGGLLECVEPQKIEIFSLYKTDSIITSPNQ